MPSVDCDSLAAVLISHFVGLVHIGCGGILRQIYSFTDRGITMLLKCSLHPNVPLRLDIVGALEDFADFGGYSPAFLDASGFGDMPLEDFTHGLYKNVKRIAFAVEIIAGLFIVDFVLHYFILR